jgi:hypothetical protein
MTLHDGMTAMGTDISIDLRNKSYSITAEFDVDSRSNGAIVCQGGRFGGLSFFLLDGKPAFTYNFLGLETTTITATDPLGAGKHKVTYDFAYDGGGAGKGGTGVIKIDGVKVAEGRLERTQPGIFSVDDLADVGVDLGTPVTDYGASSRFTGKILTVMIETKE